MKTQGQPNMNFNTLSENSCFQEFFSNIFGSKFQTTCLPGGSEAGGEGESAIGMKCTFINLQKIVHPNLVFTNFSQIFLSAKFQITCLPGGSEAGGEGESAIGMKWAFGGIRCEDIGEWGAECGKAGDP